VDSENHAIKTVNVNYSEIQKLYLLLKIVNIFREL